MTLDLGLAVCPLTAQGTHGNIVCPESELCYVKIIMEALESTEAAILDRVIRPSIGGWPRAAAEAILSVSFDAPDRERMTQLLQKAKAGELSESEAREIENYRHVGRLLELLKSRARRSLEDA
jgi:hypothetical protein